MSTDIRIQMGRRLAEERERLGFKQKQAEFAELAAVKPRTYQDWERGVSTPSAEFLAFMSTKGLDPLYVLTGVRQPKEWIGLAPDEAALVDNYKHADEEGRAAARRVLSSLAQQKAA